MSADTDLQGIKSTFFFLMLQDSIEWDGVRVYFVKCLPDNHEDAYSIFTTGVKRSVIVIPALGRQTGRFL